VGSLLCGVDGLRLSDSFTLVTNQHRCIFTVSPPTNQASVLSILQQTIKVLKTNAWKFSISTRHNAEDSFWHDAPKVSLQTSLES
jgi:hypothetical protein